MDNHPSRSEWEVKLERMRGLLDRFSLDGLLLRQNANFSWAACGAEAHINIADPLAAASLLVTRSERLLLANNIEGERLMQEAGLAAQGWDLRVSPWHSGEDPLSEWKRRKLGADTPLPGARDLGAEVAALRAELTPEEGGRFRELGRLCAQGMGEAIHAARPGMTEYELGANLAQAVESRGVQAVVVLAAVDERIFAYRHPLPTARKLQKYAMLILCGRKGGLICSVTRLVHFGALPAELRRKAEAVARIDAEMIAATRPDVTLGDVFRTAQEAYAAAGFPDEWQLHHQGGTAGYAPREVIATPRSTQPVLAGQVFAWNPSITGTKSEDTFLVGGQGNEILTAMPGWPTLAIPVGEQVLLRPAILEK